MTEIIGVRFRTAGKIFYFLPGEEPVTRGTHVIVETARGIEYGTVVFGPKEINEEDAPQPIRLVLRVSTPEDDAQVQQNHEKEVRAKVIAKQKIADHGLEMKLVAVEYTFDGSRILFYFTADGRVDFRELVKDLASVFHTRIELRQIGVRDETKILGGIGICGRPLCCTSWLTDFVPVSIKMAKEQSLSLNPVKISGICGRLMCCLKNEEETYEYLDRQLPRIGTRVTADDGSEGIVASVNVLKQTVKVQILTENTDDDRKIEEYRVDQLKFASSGRPGQAAGDEALRQARELKAAAAENAAVQVPSSGNGTQPAPEDQAQSGAPAGELIPVVAKPGAGDRADSQDGGPEVQRSRKSEYRSTTVSVNAEGVVSQISTAVQATSSVRSDGTEVSQMSASVSVTRTRRNSRGPERPFDRGADRGTGQGRPGSGRRDLRGGNDRTGRTDRQDRNRYEDRQGRGQTSDRGDRRNTSDRFQRNAQRPQTGQTGYDRNRRPYTNVGGANRSGGRQRYVTEDRKNPGTAARSDARPARPEDSSRNPAVRPDTAGRQTENSRGENPAERRDGGPAQEE